MKSLNYILIFILVLLQSSCSDNAVIDHFEGIPNTNWSYAKPIKAKVEILDPAKLYNIYINFRHTADYKYANIWLRITIIDPSKKKTVERKEFQLALKDGEWIGKGSGNLYSYQLILNESFKFSQKGNYQFIIEQNMRDNPLKAVSDVGLRIEPAS